MKPPIKNIERHLLSDDWATLHRIDYDYKFENGQWRRVSRESYNRGNGTAILLYNLKKGTVILTKQFRMPVYENKVSEAMSIEVCAGALDKDENPEECIIREVEEEVGFKIQKANEVLQAYMSPGALTEKLHLFTAEISKATRIHRGGGLKTENEDIEVLELKFKDAMRMIEKKEIIDAKTIMLLQYASLNNLITEI